jgi:hypothetical protein
MGAFSRLALRWDGEVVPPSRATVLPGGTTDSRHFEGISVDRPVSLPVGRRTHVTFRPAQVQEGTHCVRLELYSVAIPPTVWLEFSDRLTIAPAA